MVQMLVITRALLDQAKFLQANTLDSNLPLAKLGLAQIDLLRHENTNAITLLESTLQDVPGWMDALKVCALFGL